MKSKLLTTIQQAFPGKEINRRRFPSLTRFGIRFKYSLQDEEALIEIIEDFRYLKIMIHGLEKFNGPIPLENGQPDWEFIKKILVNWRSF